MQFVFQLEILTETWFSNLKFHLVFLARDSYLVFSIGFSRWISSWDFQLNFRAGISRWVIHLDFSWIFQLGNPVKISSWTIQLDTISISLAKVELFLIFQTKSCLSTSLFIFSTISQILKTKFYVFPRGRSLKIDSSWA